MAALENDHFHASWVEGIKDQEAIAAYIQAFASGGWRAKENTTRLLDTISPKWRQNVIPSNVKKLLSDTFIERQKAVRLLSNLEWKPVNETEKMSYWLATGKWTEFEMAGTSANQFLLSNLKIYNPFASEKDEIESFANAIKTLIKINKDSPECLIADENAAIIGNNFGTLVLLSGLKDEAASDRLNTLLMNATKEERKKLFSFLEQVGWVPQKEAGAWYWIENEEWEKAGAIGKTAARPLLDYISDENQEKYDKIKASAAITQTGDKSVIPEMLARARAADWDMSKALTSAVVALEPENLEYQMITTFHMATLKNVNTWVRRSLIGLSLKSMTRNGDFTPFEL